MKIFLSKETLSVIKNAYIFIDTCILLDFAALKNQKDKAEFRKNLSLFTENGCIFVTIEPVAAEFYLGSTRQDLKIKYNYFSQLVKVTVPVKIIKKDIIVKLIIEYGRYARGSVSYADLCLGAAVKQFPNSLVLTRNHKDFPLRIFECKGVFIVHLDKEARTYCFYK